MADYPAQFYDPASQISGLNVGDGFDGGWCKAMWNGDKAHYFELAHNPAAAKGRVFVFAVPLRLSYPEWPALGRHVCPEDQQVRGAQPVQ